MCDLVGSSQYTLPSVGLSSEEYWAERLTWKVWKTKGSSHVLVICPPPPDSDSNLLGPHWLL